MWATLCNQIADAHFLYDRQSSHIRSLTSGIIRVTRLTCTECKYMQSGCPAQRSAEVTQGDVTEAGTDSRKGECAFFFSLSFSLTVLCHAERSRNRVYRRLRLAASLPLQLCCNPLPIPHSGKFGNEQRRLRSVYVKVDTNRQDSSPHAMGLTGTVYVKRPQIASGPTKPSRHIQECSGERASAPRASDFARRTNLTASEELSANDVTLLTVCCRVTTVKTFAKV